MSGIKKGKPLRQKLVSLVWPIAFQQFMLALVGASDALMLVRLQQNAMSAVSLAAQVTFVFNLFMTAFVIGENMFIAQYYGKKDYDNIAKVFALVLRIACLTSVFLQRELFFFPRPLCVFSRTRVS